MKNNRVRTRWHLRSLNIVRTLLLVGLTLAVSLGLASARWATAHAASGSPALVSQANCSPSVKVVFSPNPGSASNGLIWIEVVSASNTWAVGFFQNTTGPGKTLIEHWNGSRWKVVSSPNPGSANNILNEIEAVSASDIWAVGGLSNTTPPSFQELQTLVEHWNGSSWSVVPSPSPGSSANQLGAIEAVSTTTLWAVGGLSNTTGPSKTLIEKIVCG